MKLDKGEKLIISVRKHWFIIFLEGFIFFLVAIFPAVLAFIAFKYLPQVGEFDLGGELIYLLSFLYFIYLFGIWIGFFVAWTDYYLDVWYVTPKRIIAIDQKGLFRREIIDLRFEKVQDATIEINGIIPTLLNFGDLHVQTAGTRREIILRQARRPDLAKKIILNRHSEVMEKERSFDKLVKNE